MEAVKPATVLVGRTDRAVVIRLNGPATAVVSTRLKKHLASARQPDVTDVYFDLSGTPLVDSTFVGMMLSLAVRRTDPALPTVHLLRPSSGVKRALESMHVCELLDCCEECEAAITEWRELPAEDVGQDSVAGLVIDAHECLIEADERNVPVFSPVVEGFRARRRPKH